MGINLAPSTLVFFLVSLMELFFFGIAIIYFKLKRKKISDEFTLIFQIHKRGARDWILGIGIGLGIGIILYLYGQILIIATIKVVVLTLGRDFYIIASEGSINVTPPSVTILDLTVTILVSYLIIGPSEEFFFRGFLYRETSKLSVFWRFIITSFIFALFHVFPGLVPIQTTVTYIFFYFIMGLLFTWVVYFKKGDLIPAIIAHGTYNSIIFLFNFLF
jgi:membrane protease YdiL (CAAX protease family)